MRHIFPRSFTYSAAFVLATLFPFQRAAAQAYDASQDPFVGRATNMGEQMRTERGFGSTLDYGPSNWFGRRFGRMRFPAPPPALGEDLANRTAPPFGDAVASDFTWETFYGPYAMLLDGQELSEKKAKRIAAYRSARQALLEELRRKLAEVADAAPEARQAAFNELAAQQEGRLQVLANEAESIRADLATTGTANEFRIGLWHRTADFKQRAERFLWVLYSYYFDAGLSTEQRELLPEIAFDQRSLFTAQKEKTSGPGSDYFYFLPAGARIRVPATLPSSLMEKIRTCVKEKESLKNELRTEILRDGEIYTRQRTNRFTQLAERQAPRFAALYKLAEEIRVELAAFDYPDRPVKQAMPADLTQRIGDFYDKKIQVQRELVKRKLEVQRQFPAAYVAIERVGDGLAIKQEGVSPEKAASLAEFNASLARRYAALARESENLRGDIQRFNQASSKPEERSVDQLASDFAKAYAVQENWNQYDDYYRAVLEPGLSSAQRVLLFHSAATKLAQDPRTLHP